jgi:putative peptide zinc metalloprotease protein
MNSPLHSPLWYRVANLVPALRQHVAMHRHVYRGEVWFLIQDPATGRVHRFASAAQRIIGLMDGSRTVQEIWSNLESSDANSLPTQDETIQLLGQLHAADLLSVETTPDTQELFRRSQVTERKERLARIKNPLAIRLPLIDPGPFLTRFLPAVSWLLSPVGFILWLAVIVAAAILAGMHWPELSDNVIDRVVTPENLFFMGLSYPLIKALHELGHGFAARRWGGEVHEMGIMLLVFMPVPYVDASSASVFPDKRHRMIVGAAGIFVEMFIAAVAMFVWVLVEPGLVRALAFNVILIAGASTIFINGNPLLRFDGYYVLADYLEIPNLASRSKRFIGYLVKRYVFIFEGSYSPASTSGERFWLPVYAMASFAYRMFIMFAIVFLVADRFYAIGSALAIWAISTQIVWPSCAWVYALTRNQEFRRQRFRSLATGVLLVGALAVVLGWTPMPLSTRAQGVVWLPQNSEIRAGADAVIVELVAEPNGRVAKGDVLIKMEDSRLDAAVMILEAAVAEATARYESLRSTELIEAQMTRDEIDGIEADLEVARERRAALVVKSPAAGQFIIERPQDLEGQYVHHGDLLAYVADQANGTLAVVVSQDDIGLIREQTHGVSIRLAHQLGTEVPAWISRQQPAATNRLPSVALGGQSGGPMATDPGDAEGITTLEQFFRIELTAAMPLNRIGERAFVRFDHGREPLALQWYRRLRQVFLRRLDV